MQEYIDIIVNSYAGYADYLWREITFQYDYKPFWQNYFWLLMLVSGFFFAVEISRPWRKDQPKFRMDFWLDFFYMFFNFFLFSLVFYNALSDVFVNLFGDFLSIFGVSNLVAIQLDKLPVFAQLFAMFLIRDFVQWWGHRTLHKMPQLWEFHKVHHSVQQMGFAAHLRYHWFENVFYRTFEYIPLAMLGFGIDDFFMVHIFTLAWGHFNHSNISVSGKVSGAVVGLILGLGITSMIPSADFLMGAGITVGTVLTGSLALGPHMRKIFNSPEMHIWHHAHHLPKERQTGVNFGMTLAIWDYVFDTAYVPYDGRDIKLGFPGVEKFPTDFAGQNLHGFGLTKREKEHKHLRGFAEEELDKVAQGMNDAEAEIAQPKPKKTV